MGKVQNLPETENNIGTRWENLIIFREIIKMQNYGLVKCTGAMENCSGDCVGYRGRICCFDMFLAQGFLYEIEGDLDNALSCYKSALQENPLDFDACYARKRLKKERKDDKAYDDRNRFGNNQ